MGFMFFKLSLNIFFAIGDLRMEGYSPILNCTELGA